jgi:hypothetical protein
MPRIVEHSAPQPAKAGRSRKDVPLPQFVPFQLSQPVEKPPSGPQWLHEIKLDGYRMAARIDNDRVQLLTRTGLDWTAKYPGAVAALANVNVKTAYLDGELCGVDDAGLPSFAQTQAATDGEPSVHLVYYAFDLLHIGGWDVSSLQLVERKALLEPLISNKPGLQFTTPGTANSSCSTPASSVLRVSSPRRSTRPMRREIAAYGARRKLSTGKSSSSAGPTRKGHGLISGPSCSATTRMKASSLMPAAWGRECLTKCSPICAAASTRSRANRRPSTSCPLGKPVSARR